MKDNWQFAVTIAAIVVGIFFNNRAADRVRSDLTAQINNVRSDLTGQLNLLSGRIDMVISKLMEVMKEH